MSFSIRILAIVLLALASDSGLAGQSEPAAPQVVSMTAKKYEFSPATVTVVRGRPVRIEATALDRTHGIEIEELGVKARLEKGKTTTIEFTPDRTGEFEIKCSVFCGLGHGHMKGKLIVVAPPAA
jgi:cytochrome c oxidase subunit 2